MSYKEERARLVRQEKNYMSHFISAHKEGDVKTKCEIGGLMEKNVEARRRLKK